MGQQYVKPQMVPKDYKMDPETEAELPDGYGLKNGMIVLIKSENLRVDLKSPNPYEIENARWSNRWAIVSSVRLNPGFVYSEIRHEKVRGGGTHGYETGNTERTGPLIEFVATYEDGLTRRRMFHPSHAWLVKKHSIVDEIRRVHVSSSADFDGNSIYLPR